MVALLPAQSPALADHRHRITADWLEDDAVTTAKLADSVYGGTPTTIDPDDAGTAGSAATVSRSDHGHQFTTSAPSSLTKTATNSEGSGGTMVRNDHGHATDVLPWGIIARQALTADSSGITATGTTDFALASVVVDSTRLYKVHFHCSRVVVSAAGAWEINFHVDTTLTDQFAYYQEGASARRPFSSSVLWEPTSGTKSLDIRVVEVSGTSTLTFEAAAARPRRFWVEDIGPR